MLHSGGVEEARHRAGERGVRAVRQVRGVLPRADDGEAHEWAWERGVRRSVPVRVREEERAQEGLAAEAVEQRDEGAEEVQGELRGGREGDARRDQGDGAVLRAGGVQGVREDGERVPHQVHPDSGRHLVREGAGAREEGD